MVRHSIHSPRAFSLVEVIIAFSLVVFVLVTILGLFTTGLRSVSDSERQIEAANLASALIGERIAQPTNTLAGSPLPVINLTQLATSAGSNASVYIDAGGTVVSRPSDARFRVTSAVWRDTTFSTNSDLVRVEVQLSWPPAATNASKTYTAMTSFHAVL